MPNKAAKTFTTTNLLNSVSEYCVLFCVHLLLFRRYNGQEMGRFVATQIIDRHIDPTSPNVDFLRPATGKKSTQRGSGMLGKQGGFSASASNYASGSTSSLRKPVPVSADALPKFLQPKTVSHRLPGDLFIVRSRLPVLPVECVPSITGELGGERLCLLKVSQF